MILSPSHILRPLRTTLLVTLLGLSALSASAQTPTTLHVDTKQVIGRLSPLLYGTCLEDVNHEVYGGLYGQLLYGESLEEAPEITQYADCFSNDAPWHLDGDEIYVNAAPVAKLTYQRAQVNDGWAETEIRWDGLSGKAGLVVRALGVGTGANTYRGYYCALDAWSHKLTFGKQDSVWTTLYEQTLDFQPTVQWTKMRLELNGNRFGIYINNIRVAEVIDKVHPLTTGRIGLRAEQAMVAFRHLKVYDGKEEKEASFANDNDGVSGMWHLYKHGTPGVLSMDSTTSVTGRYSQRIVNYGSGPLGIDNMGLNRWGLALRQGQALNGYVYLKGQVNAAYIQLRSADDRRVYASERIKDISPEWERYDFTLTPSANDDSAKLVVYIDSRGTLWVDQACLMPSAEQQFKGLPCRKDLAESLQGQNLKMIRYGGSMVNSPEYRVRNMWGEVDRRPPYRGSWNRYSSNGFAITEFVRMAKSIHAEPCFAINIEENPEDAALLIEYLNGSVATKGGQMRMANGHPEPYGVKYVEIGNEEAIQSDSRELYDHYIERFGILTDAMLKADPHLQFVSAAWWRSNSRYMEHVVKALAPKAAYWDLHPWVDDIESAKRLDGTLSRMKELLHKWAPEHNIRCVIFEENGMHHNVGRMLAHALAFNAVRRHGDFVITSCQANALQPYKQNDNGWDQGQIFFTPAQVWYQPTYYAVQQASRYDQPLCVATSAGDDPDIDLTATRSDNGKTVVLHVVNSSAESKAVDLDIQGFGRSYTVKTVSLSGKLQADNTAEKPERISPLEHLTKYKSTQSLQLQGHSYTIIICTK